MVYRSANIPAAPLLVGEPRIALVDEPVSIQLYGLAPRQKVTIHASTHDSQGHVWTASATFSAGATGTIDVSSQQPENGTYRGVDAMGLFWSMSSFACTKELLPFTTILQPMLVDLRAEVAGTSIAQVRIERHFVGSNVSRTDLHEQGLAGIFFQPGTPGPHPAVLILGGSSGTLREQEAALLASRGFCTLALAYFGSDHLPPGLVEIPLEYFESAFQWLQNSTAVLPTKVAVMGVSKGAEAALLLGSTFAAVKAVISYAPSALTFQGLATSEEDDQKSSWSYQGKPLPFVTYKATPAFLEYEQTAREANLPLAFRSLYLSSLDDVASVEQATIPVEKINGPVLLISGKDDQMWPSDLFGAMIEKRLTKYNHPYPYQHLSYASAGHKIGLPFMPTTTLQQASHPRSGLIYAYGGTTAGNASASSHSWRAVLDFLEESLKR
ncbi:MAG: acyl-CoA thioesterase/bile acid-CoA:amino acid N-acyltransferase family protein [Ktedonobacteraceae bacterium]